MKIGVLKEIKSGEKRVALTPTGAAELVKDGHEVYVQSTAGSGVGIFDYEYTKAGAIVVDTADEIFEKAKLILKVKEPQLEECVKLNKDHILFTYLHLAAFPEHKQLLENSKVTAIAYELVKADDSSYPLLTPMSEIAGKLSVQVGAYHLQTHNGGSGVILGGVPGASKGNVVIIGGGVAGTNAAKIALGMGSNVTILDNSLTRLRQLDDIFQSRINLEFSSENTLYNVLSNADLVIGSVLIPGKAAPKIITEDMIQIMPRGTVIVDIAIDQGGCFETSKATTHDDPTFVKHAVIHYCVPNMPSAVARTATLALTNATLPYIKQLAKKWTITLREAVVVG